MKQTLTTLTGACVLVLSTQAIADTKPPQVYGTISARVVDFSDTNFIGQDVDSTPTLYEGIVGLKGLHIPQKQMAVKANTTVQHQQKTRSLFATQAQH